MSTNAHKGENIAVARSKLRSPKALNYSSRLWPLTLILLHIDYDLLSKLSKDAANGKSVSARQKKSTTDKVCDFYTWLEPSVTTMVWGYTQ